jgi:predicted transglutaminase-like cysteine proteinase
MRSGEAQRAEEGALFGSPWSITVISKNLRTKLGAVVIAALATSGADALPALAESASRAVLVAEVTQAPPGWADFCAREPMECAGPATTPRDIALSWEAWMDLVRINNWVNKTIKPLTDIEHWGVVERWSYPDDGYGDCEDYVLLKRRMLMQLGWPREALLVTVVRDQKNQGHAVLTVTTDKGDYVLDNQNKNILLWSETGYRFIKRQSQASPNVWVSLGGHQRTIATATSR